MYDGQIQSNQQNNLSIRYQPRLSSILKYNKKTTLQEVFIFLNNNFFKIIKELLSVLALFLFLLFYLHLRIIKREEIQNPKTSPYSKQNKCQNDYEINKCDEIHQNDKPPPFLVKKCQEFDQCRKEKFVIPTISELAIEHIGFLVQIFINELNSKTIMVIFTFLIVFILVDAIRNRPKIVI